MHNLRFSKQNSIGALLGFLIFSILFSSCVNNEEYQKKKKKKSELIQAHLMIVKNLMNNGKLAKAMRDEFNL